MENSGKLSKELLGKLLNCEIISFTVKPGSNVGDNYLSIMHALHVSVKRKVNDKNVEETLYLLSKCFPSHPARQKYLEVSNVFFIELSVYKIWIPELIKFQMDMGLTNILRPAFPQLFGGQTIDFSPHGMREKYADHVFDPWDNCVIMSDVRATLGYTMTSRHDSVDWEHTALIVEELAKIHALSWAYMQKKKIVSIAEKFPFLSFRMEEEIRNVFDGMVANSVDTGLEVLDSEFGEQSPISKRVRELRGDIMRINDVYYCSNTGDMEKELVSLIRVRPDDDLDIEVPWRVVCHGDSWVNNMLFQYDENTKKPTKLILVDLQFTREACPTMDLIYLAYVCMDHVCRKQHLDAMLRLYFEKFCEFCTTLNSELLPGFTFTSFKRRFHRAKLFGFATAIFILPIILKDAEEAVNMEDMKSSANMNDLMGSVITGTGTSTRYRDRLLGVMKDLYDDGIL